MTRTQAHLFLVVDTEIGCQICRKVMTLPVTTPCAHNFCKAYLEGKFAGITQVRERSRGGRSLRVKKNMNKCPCCTTDLSEFLQNPQVNGEVMDLIENLKKKEGEKNSENATASSSGSGNTKSEEEEEEEEEETQEIYGGLQSEENEARKPWPRGMDESIQRIDQIESISTLLTPNSKSSVLYNNRTWEKENFLNFLSQEQLHKNEHVTEEYSQFLSLISISILSFSSRHLLTLM